MNKSDSNGRYILEGHKAVPEPDLMKWAAWIEHSDNRRVARTAVDDKVFVSTVFLGVDYDFTGHGTPILFETMIFGGPLDEYQERCGTWAEAVNMHRRAVSRAKKAAKEKL